MPFRFARPAVAGIAVAALLSTSVLAGCGSSSSSSGSKKTPSSKSLTNVYFILNWLPNVEFAGLWVAQEKGWWKQAGISMSFKGWSPGVFPETDVPNRGGNTFGFQDGAAIAIAKSKGVPIQALYSDTQRSVFGLTVLSKSHIMTLKDLKGKKVGYQSHELYVPEEMLDCAGLKSSDWKPVQVGFDTSQLTSGAVDAYLTFLTNEPIALKLQGVKIRNFAAADYCYHFYDDVMFTSTSLIKSDPALVKKVTSVVARGFQWAHTHPNEAARITVNKYFPAAKGTSAAQNLKQQQMELQAFTPFSKDANGQFSGKMSQAYWQDSINTLFKYGLIKSKPSASAIFTNQYNPMASK